MAQVYIRIINLEKRGENVKGGRMFRVNFHIVHIVAEINGFDFLKRSHFFSFIKKWKCYSGHFLFMASEKRGN